LIQVENRHSALRGDADHIKESSRYLGIWDLGITKVTVAASKMHTAD
jgi:hypothetical protein